MTVSSDEQSLELVAGIPDPTRTRGYGSGRFFTGRVGSGTGTTSTGTGIPGFTREEHDFGTRTFQFLYVF